jgi:hypothetical protein
MDERSCARAENAYARGPSNLDIPKSQHEGGRGESSRVERVCHDVPLRGERRARQR